MGHANECGNEPIRGGWRGGETVIFWQGVHWESNTIWSRDSVGLSLWEGGTIRELESFSGGGGEGRGFAWGHKCYTRHQVAIQFWQHYQHYLLYKRKCNTLNQILNLSFGSSLVPKCLFNLDGQLIHCKKINKYCIQQDKKKKTKKKSFSLQVSLHFMYPEFILPFISWS